MIARLQSVSTSESTAAIPLERLPVTLGRGDEADVRIVDQFTSRRHCRILQVNDELVVQDLGSTWGTLVNGQPIAEARLHFGDALTIGTSTFRVEQAAPSRGSLLSRIEMSIKKLAAMKTNRSPEVANS